MLLAAGALAGLGRMSLPAIVATAVGATLLADSIWYGLGRVRGNRIIEMLSRFSLAHGASIRRAKELFFAHRAQCLIVAKFLPGINPLAVGLAGIFAVAPAEFLLCDATGALVWAGAWMTVGYFCADMISAIVHEAARVGAPLLGVAVAGLVVFFVARHVVRRHRFLRQLAEPRLGAEDLKQRLDTRAPVVVIDLRTALDLTSAPVRNPGAQLISPDDLDAHQLPREREIVLYCSEPHEATSVRAAGDLAAAGTLSRVHVLGGGLEGWRRRGYPVEEIPAPARRITR